MWSLLTSRIELTPPSQRQQNQKKADKNNPSIFKKEPHWREQYIEGLSNELYRVPLKTSIYEGYKYKDVCMILYHKMRLILIALEIKIGNQIKVFVNPAEYVFEPGDHHGYVINHSNPDAD